MAALNDDA